ncbi:MAG TPA: glycerophosphodiester phosphodiesterase family protein [Pyrinomonadaceae bacterium]|nr:glycerophosphodiester phosphodiesterase family protein [Pyrinomonadaceae bacterium]
MSVPLIIAHRGASALAPENTISAFKKAIDSGADGIEFDVRLSKDRVPVVIHDPTLTRTAGIDAQVGDLTAEELSKADVGSWFNAAHPAHAQPGFSAERISTLQTVLQLLENVSGPIYIELKCEAENHVQVLVDAVCREIASSPALAKIIVKSFRLEVIPRTRAVLPSVRTAALFAPKVMRLLRKEKYLIDIARELGADHLSVHKSLVSAKLVRKAGKYGMPVTAWTVDRRRWRPWAENRGLFALITNDPAKMLAGREPSR